jgi:hypothetical protein
VFPAQRVSFPPWLQGASFVVRGHDGDQCRSARAFEFAKKKIQIHYAMPTYRNHPQPFPKVMLCRDEHARMFDCADPHFRVRVGIARHGIQHGVARFGGARCEHQLRSVAPEK